MSGLRNSEPNIFTRQIQGRRMNPAPDVMTLWSLAILNGEGVIISSTIRSWRLFFVAEFSIAILVSGFPRTVNGFVLFLREFSICMGIESVPYGKLWMMGQV